MHKTLLLLGLLRQGPMSGYDIHRIVRAHGQLYSDLKKGNVYYLLDRLAVDGYLRVEAEPGARGPRGERLIYSLTDRGRERFEELLREVLRSYDTLHSGVDAAILFLAELPRGEAISLLETRRKAVEEHRALLKAELQDRPQGDPLLYIVADHLRTLVDAELAWVDRAITLLRGGGPTGELPRHASDTGPAPGAAADAGTGDS